MTSPMTFSRTILLAFTVFAASSAVGCEKKAPPSASSCTPSEVKGGKAFVCADEKGFTPQKLEVKKGETLQITFLRTSNETCATEIVAPELGIDKKLPLNVPVTVDVPTAEAKALTFACGMKMFTSTVIVTP